MHSNRLLRSLGRRSAAPSLIVRLLSMSKKPTNRFFDTPIEEWLSLISNELEIDAVGLWQVVPPLVHDFGLVGKELELYVKQAITALINRGAVPISGKHWEVRTDLFSPSGPDIELIMAYWQALDHEPTFEDLWFNLPASGSSQEKEPNNSFKADK